MQLVDTHTHLFSDKFGDDRREAIQRAIDAGVKRMYMPNISSETTAAMNQTVAMFPDNCFAMIGLHPCHVDEGYDKEISHIKDELETGKYVAIGETGLDYHWDLTFKNQQQEALRQQIAIAKDYKLPIVLHTRESFDDTYQLIKEQNDNSLSGVFHCFSGSLEDAQKVEALGGFYIGIGGVATFKKTNHTTVLPEVPLDMIVLETDSPYLAPVPYRGKRNESAYLPEIAKRIAEIKNIALEELAEVTTRNALSLYNTP